MAIGRAWDGFVEDGIAGLRGHEREFFRGRTVLVTGAGGYLGSGLTRALVRIGVRGVVLLDSAEYGLYRLQQWLDVKSFARGTLVLGSVTDRGLMRDVFARHRPEVVFHCAALKHAPLLEGHAIVAAATNVLGTQVVLSEAVRYGVDSVVLLSTDKAVEPLGVMGATKCIAERMVARERGSGRTGFRVVRLCNVLGSTGSVAPKFVRQIGRGLALTVSDAEATRFFMTRGDAVRLLLRSAAAERCEGLIVPVAVAPRRVEELARFLHARLARGTAEIVYTGLRPGDKLHERLLAEGERIVRRGVGWDEVSMAEVGEDLEERIAALGRAIALRDEAGVRAGIAGLVPELGRADRVAARGDRSVAR